jgi:hypothetical protein
VFLLGHECGHTLLGHLNPDVARKGILPFDSAKAEVLLPAHGEELAADIVGYKLLTEYAEVDRVANSSSEMFATAASAPDIFFSLVDALHGYLSLAAGHYFRWGLDSHPAPALRRSMVREFDAFCRQGPIDNSIAIFGIRYQIILRCLCLRTREYFLKSSAQFGGPSPVWQSESNNVV